jgi:hypothetical protein
MVSFQTKNPNLGKFWRSLDGKMFIYFMAIWKIIPPFGMFYVHFGTFCAHLVHFSGFDILCQEKSGNPGAKDTKLIKHIKIFFFSCN